MSFIMQPNEVKNMIDWLRTTNPCGFSYQKDAADLLENLEAKLASDEKITKAAINHEKWRLKVGPYCQCLVCQAVREADKKKE